MSRKDKLRQHAARSGRKADRSSPLRKIIGYKQVNISRKSYIPVDREVLECGHVVRIKEDWHGETIAVRRRCKPCAAGKPPDLDPDVFLKELSE